LRTFCLALALLCPVLGLAAMTAPASASEPEEAPSGDVEEHHYVRLDAISVTLFDEKSVVGLYTVAPTWKSRRKASAPSSRKTVRACAMR